MAADLQKRPEGPATTPRRGPRRSLLVLLAATVAFAVGVVATIQVVGGGPGAPCADSYSCRGFLIGGAECVVVDGGTYCTVYCDADADCPDGWSCEGANPTVLLVETTAVDEVCIRPSGEAHGGPR